MRLHKKLLIALGLLITVTVAFGIHLYQLSTPTPCSVLKAKGTVQFGGMEGENWLIRLDNGSVCHPTNLPGILKISGLRVWFKAEIIGYNVFTPYLQINLIKITAIFTLGRLMIPADVIGMGIGIGVIITIATYYLSLKRETLQ